MKVYQHIIFWILVYVIMTLVIADWFGSGTEAFFYVCFLLPVVMGTSYFFNFFLVPRYLFKRRFFEFGLYSFYMLVVSLCAELIVSLLSMLFIIEVGISDNGVIIYDVFTLAGLLYMVVLAKSFVLLLKHYYLDQRTIHSLEEAQKLNKQGFITVRSQRKDARVILNEILFVESLADYIKFHMKDGVEIISREKISHLGQKLPTSFLRIHRSYIVNTNNISSYAKEEIVIGEKELPVSRTYKKAVVEALSAAK